MIALLGAVSDQISKYLISHFMHAGESWPIIPKIFHLTYVQNTGAAFGLLRGNNTMLAIIAAVLIIAVVVAYNITKKKDPLFIISLSFILGGSMGNLCDRITRGYVVDFLDFRVWPVFNLADSLINIGFILLVIHILMRKGERNASDTA
ncbi:MAG: signal peptidase II [bacterium]